MNNPVISVVMSVFNGERFLAEAIESILGQSYGDFEFIIVNDGSTDNSGSLLARYEEKDARVRIVNQSNAGLIPALNRGCALARGRYIARMDADDVAIRERLALQVAFLDANPRVAVVGGAVEFIDARGNSLLVAPNPQSNEEIQRALLDACVLWHPTAIFRKSVFASVRGYRSVPDAEDYDFWLRIADRFELANLPAVLLKYRVHPGQVSVTRSRKMALGALACRAAAVIRRGGRPDPLDGVTEITADVLDRLGLSHPERHTAIARGYLSCLRNMHSAGDEPGAANMIQLLLSAECALAARWTIADTHLVAAKLHWKHRKFAASLASAVRAVATRPAILGRPVKRLLSLLREREVMPATSSDWRSEKAVQH